MRLLLVLGALALALGQLSARADLVISELDLANSRVEIVNTGDSMVDMTGYRWCNRDNGSPFYPGVSAGTINPGLSTATSLQVQPGEILTFDLTSAFLPAAGGELGLYLPASAGGFGSRAALVDYVLWGNRPGVRDSVADDAPAIWVLNTAVDISSLGAGDTIQLNVGAPGDGVGDYSVAPATAGVAQSIPEPVTLEITAIGFVDAKQDTIFIEFEYSGSGTVVVKESTDLTGFTDVSARTAVTNPLPNRLVFTAPDGRRGFFRLEEG